MSTIRLERLENPNTSNGGIDIDSSGKVGIGTTSPSTDAGSGAQNLVIGTAASSVAGMTINTGTGSYQGRINFGRGTTNQDYGYILCDHANGFLSFGLAASERARIDDSGRLLVGSSTARTNVREAADNETPKVQFESATNDYSGAGLSIINNSSSGFAPQLWLGRSASNSIGGNALVSSGRIGSISFNAADGTNFIQGARIQADIDGTTGSGDLPTRLVFSTTADGASSPTERMRMTSTGVLQFQNYNNLDSLWNISTGYGVSIYGGTNASVQVCRNNDTTVLLNRIGTDGNIVNFYKAGNYVGSISVTSSNTSFNTSSDYRLKENIVPVADGIDRLKQLTPSRFNFIAEPNKTVDGFVAHEVQGIVPEAVTGEKDAVELWKEGDDLPDGVSIGDNKLDDDGNTIPVYQGIDQSKLVPLLTAALQEAIAKIETLEAKVAALEVN